MRLYLVRHPRPLVAKDICYGSTNLSVSPEEHSNTLSALSAILPKGAPLFSSPLRRCAELADSVAEAFLSTSVKVDARLMEMHFGDWEMRAWNDIPRTEIDAWTKDVVAYHPGGGESVTQMAERVCAFYADVLQLQQDCVVICHAGTIRLLVACQGGLPLTETAQHAAQNRYAVAYGEVVILDC
jgi:alpha-ribazole phosphatase